MSVFNARSLSNIKQLGEFVLILRSCKFNIVAVWETWLNKYSAYSLLDTIQYIQGVIFKVSGTSSGQSW